MVRVYRLEFLQPDGRWTGPYCAEYMTRRAFELRVKMNKSHLTTRPFPNEQIFADNPSVDRYVCGSGSVQALFAWFGGYLRLFLQEGGHIGVYRVPARAIVLNDGKQIVYQQRHGLLISRSGSPVESAIVRKLFGQPIDEASN